MLRSEIQAHCYLYSEHEFPGATDIKFSLNYTLCKSCKKCFLLAKKVRIYICLAKEAPPTLLCNHYGTVGQNMQFYVLCAQDFWSLSLTSWFIEKLCELK